MQQRRTTYLALEGRKRGVRRARLRPALAVALSGFAVTALVVGGIVLTPSEPSEAATRTAVASCVTVTSPSEALGERFAGCRTRVNAWLAAHRHGFDSRALIAWSARRHLTHRVSAAPSPAVASDPRPTAIGGAPAGTDPRPSASQSAAEPTSAPADIATSVPTSAATATPTPSLAPADSDGPTPTPSVTPSVTASVSAATPTAPMTSGTTDPTATAAGFTASMGSRPNSGAVTCDGQSNVTITGKTFEGIGDDTPAITIRNCSNVTITQNDFIDDAEPIYVVNSTNVTIEYNRYQNITGPHQRNGSHRGNFTQWENSTGGSISHNVGVGGDTEDIVSIYKSGGQSVSDPLVIEDNWFQGTNWTSSSGSGIMLGDGGGSHILVQNNVLVDPGQVGIGVSGGSDITVTKNTVLGEARPSSNVGIYVWGQGASCSNIAVTDNSIDFKKASGLSSGIWNGGNCGTIAGWNSNDVAATLVLSLLQVVF